MNRTKITLLGLLLIVFGIALGFSTLNDDPKYGSPMNAKNMESALKQDKPYVPRGPSSTEGGAYYTDDFDGANDTTSLKNRGYFVWYRGTGPQGLTPTWFQGNDAVFPAFNGPTTGYVAANFNAVTSVNDIDNWLITPSANVAAGDQIKFYCRSVTANPFPDSVRVMYSASGSTTPEGSWVELGRFLAIDDGTWEEKTFSAPSAGATARYAIRYNVVDGGPLGDNSNFIGIDALNLLTPTNNDMATTANVAPVGNVILPASTIAPKATFQNVGTATQTNVPVRYTISGPVNYTSNKTIATINAGASTTVTFDSTFNPVIGTYNVTIVVSLAGDANRSNDTLYTTFTASNPNYGTANGFSFSNSVTGTGAPSQPDFCWKDTTGSTSLCVNSVNANSAIFTGSLDDGYWALRLPAGKQIRLGGVAYDSFFVSTNGIIGMARQSGLTSFSPSLTSTNRPAFYPLWQDQNLTANVNYPTNRVSYKINGYQLIVTFNRMPEFSPVSTGDYVTYQAVIDLVDAGYTADSRFLVQFNSAETGSDYLNFYNTDGLNAHVIGIQSASGAINTYYRAAYPVAFAGPMFGASDIAVQFGPDANRLNASCDATSLTLTASIEAITPDAPPSSNSGDTITVLLRSATAPYEIVDAAKGFLSASGSATLSFTKANLGSSYYIVVKHRNALETWSANPVSFTLEASYNFTSSVGQAFGSNMVSIAGAASFYSGDVNQDGFIDASDGSLVDNDAFNFVSGYVATDVNNDGFVDASDASYVENNAFNFVGLIRP